MFKSITKKCTIGVIAPAWIAVPENLQRGIAYLEKRGFKIKLGRHLNKKYGYYAGNDRERSEDIQMMFADPEVSLIICTRGGWGGLRLLDHLNFEIIGKNPKPLVGYSDVTTLQLALWKKCGMPSFSGPMVAVEMGKGIDPFTEKHFWGVMQNRRSEYLYKFRNTPTTAIKKGKASGILLGGCLSLVSHLLGTPFTPDYSGAVLFLEDIGEKPYKIDRYFAHLKQAGVFDKINALILGEFIDCEEEEENKRSFTISEIVHQYFSDAAFPVIQNFPYGHGDVKITMPIGVLTRLDADKKQLTFNNPFMF